MSIYTNTIDDSVIISLIALFISALTFWLTKIKRGTLKMTRPSIICFLGQNGQDEPKVFIRTLLYSTSEQGHYVQNMFVRLQNYSTIHNFNTWAYGDNGLVRGSGLFVNQTGVSNYHHSFYQDSIHLALKKDAIYFKFL